MMPAGTTNIQPSRKLESSPTQPVELDAILIRFLIRQTRTPDTGPSENAAISAGTSEKSSLRKDGIKGTPKSRNIKTVEIAAKNAVNAT